MIGDDDKGDWVDCNTDSRYECRQDVPYGTMCMNCVAYGDELSQEYLLQLAAENNCLEQIATNDDPQDNVESTESSSNKSYDANWDATVYANAYASENDSEDDTHSFVSDLSSDDASNSSFSDKSSDTSFYNTSDCSDDDDSDPSSDESSISLEGEIALNVNQDAFCMINPNSDEVSEDENTEEGNDDTFYSIIKYVEDQSLCLFRKVHCTMDRQWCHSKDPLEIPQGVFTAFEGSF